VFPRTEWWKTRRSKRRASEEGRPSGAGYDGAGIAGLAARPDREEDAKKEKAEDKGQRQEKDGQDQDWDRAPGYHLLIPSIYSRPLPSARQLEGVPEGVKQEGRDEFQDGVKPTFYTFRDKKSVKGRFDPILASRGRRREENQPAGVKIMSGAV
jgi:hypothetical protein